ncbi:MAG: hypothetical protein CBB68_13575 [Rhodospirillaceae bacterium TMED8]|nr:hypothetical protein [Magnetovibrio sp.]OUT48591.1 MAG: hypothetical protein CBB68_13575 [Rhodospirillaceae bacterium TMED8]
MTTTVEPPANKTGPFDDELEEAAVLKFLASHPNFFVDHPDILLKMSAPSRWAGESIVDMQQYLIERKGLEMAELRDAAQDVIETSRTNMSVQTRTHASVLSLMATRTWEDFLRVVTQDWPLLLDIEVVSLGFEIGLEPPAEFMCNEVRSFHTGYVDSLLEGDQEVRLFRAIDDDGTIFGVASGIVNSAAIARIFAGPTWPHGILALGTRDEGFRPGQGTELISFLSRVLEFSMQRAIEWEAQSIAVEPK